AWPRRSARPATPGPVWRLSYPSPRLPPMMKRSHAVIGAAAGVAVAHATGLSMMAGGIVAGLAGLLPGIDPPHACGGGARGGGGGAPCHRAVDDGRGDRGRAGRAAARHRPPARGRRPAAAPVVAPADPWAPGAHPPAGLG